MGLQQRPIATLALEPSYEAHRDAFVRTRTRAFAWLTFVINPFWVLLDLDVARGHASEILAIRLAIQVGAVGLLLLTRIEMLRRRPWVFIVLQVWLMGVSVNLMTDKLGGFSSEYYNGLNLVVLCASVLVPAFLRAHVFAEVVLIAHYVLANAHRGFGEEQRHPLMLHLYFMTTIFFVCNVSVWLFGRFHRAQYDTLRELHRANESLLGLDRAKSRLFENVSHELRTPLTLVLATFETIGREVGAQASEALAVGRRNASSLLLLIEELLQIARFDAGVATIDARPTDLAELVRTTVSQLVDPSRGRAIEVRGAEEPVMANVDRALMRKVVHNLVGNAIKFSDPDSGKVEIELSVAGFEVVLSVADDGIGIAHDQQARVFERFSQGDPDAARHYGGAGIGLALVKEVVTNHGGGVTLTSAPGEGSRFEVRLPIGEIGSATPATDEADAALLGLLALSKTAPREPPSTAPEAKVDPAQPTVLIVEDHPDLRAHLASLLGARWNVETAADGRDALDRIRERCPDLVVSDVLMPRLDGEALLRELRADPKFAQLPVVLLTAKADRAARIGALETGADDYINKPFDGEELVVRVRNLLELQRQKRELDGANARLGLELEEKLAELGRTGRLKEFFAPRVAEQLMSATTRTRQTLTVLSMELALASLGREEAPADDDALAAWLDAHHEVIARVLVDRGATVDRVGLETTAYFSAPTFATSAEQVTAALHAAREIRARVTPIAAQHARVLRSAIATGEAIVGVFGTDALRSFTAIGPPVSEARRLLAQTSGGQITLAASSREALPEHLAPPLDPAPSEVERWPVGALIAGRYRPRAWIGSGATASVYRALHVATSGEVALKILHARCGEGDEAVARLERESRAAASLQSPHTVRVFDFGRDGDAFFLVMELLDGPTVADILTRGPMTIARALGIFEQVARALGEAHAAGLVHRDIKASNVIVLEKSSAADFVKVVDFGLSRSTHTLTSASQLAGTPSYIAPEVWRGAVAGPSSDLYALGVLAYEMLAGRTPFAATDVARLGLLHCYQPVPPLPDAVPGLVRELVYWMLEKDPARRPSSAAEVAESIEDVFAEGVG